MNFLKLNKWLIAILLVILIPFSSIYGLDPEKRISQYMIDSWQIENGLPQNSGYSILQTSDGFIWIATQEGLSRFDGVSFKNFNRRNTPQLHSNWIRCLYEDSHRNLWIGTNGGITILTMGEFLTIPLFDSLPDKKIMAIAEDPHGDFWIGMDGGGLSRYGQSKIISYNTENGLTDNRVRSICVDSSGNVLAGTANGLNFISKGKIKSFYKKNGLLHNTVMSLYNSPKGFIWVGTDGGLNIFENGELRTVEQRSNSEKKIRSLFEDKKGALWVGTDGGGINRYINGYFSRISEKEGLSNNTIFSLTMDYEGNLWAGTHGGGIIRIKDGKFSNYTTIEGLLEDDIYTVMQDSRNRLWMGTTRGPGYISNSKVFNHPIGLNLENKMVTSLYEDAGGNIWFGTNGNGLFIYNGTKTRNVSTRNGLSNDRIYSISGDRRGNIWVGTWRGLNRISGNGIEKFFAKDGLTHEKIRCVLEDNDGTIWIGTDGGGLNYLKNGIISALTKKDGLSSNFISCLYEDEENNLWVGLFDGGLALIKGGNITNFTMENGLYDNAAYTILEDNQGYMWFSSNNGVYKVQKQNLFSFANGDIDSLISINYGRGDGMKSRECNGGVQPAAWKTNDGRLWFPTVAGLAMIDPDQIDRNTAPPGVVIGEVRVDDQVVKSTIQNNVKSLIIPPGKSRIEIEYSGLSLSNPEKVYFKYRLIGIDKYWIDVGNRRTAYYTSLEPGNYSFRVIAANSDHFWNLKGAQINLTLKPFFYQTKWFYFLSALFVILIVLYVFKLRINRLERQRENLEKEVSERTKELQLVNDELKRLSNEDEMTGIANHRRFLEFLHVEWKRAIRGKSSISLILFDIDKFKEINDNFGHQAGDVCLKEIAANLREVINRPGDLVARYAGDEFVVILTETDHHGVDMVAENLRVKIANTPIEVSSEGSHIRATISLGFATVIPMLGMKTDLLIKAADDQLYEAKSRGRNRSSGIDLSSLDSSSQNPHQ